MFVEVNGARLYLEKLGNSQGPTIVALHGGPGIDTHLGPKRAFGWLTDVAQLVVFDARGCGASDRVGPYTHDQWASDVEQLRQWLNVPQFVLAGGSYGGFIALEYAIRHPHELSALILRGTSADWTRAQRSIQHAISHPHVAVDREALVRAFDGKCRDDADLEYSYRQVLPLYTTQPSTRESQRAAADAVYVAATHNAAFGTELPKYDVKASLAAITCPCLVVAGSDDWIDPVDAAMELAELIRGAQLEIFADAGHNPEVEDPARFRAIVDRFLREAGLL